MCRFIPNHYDFTDAEALNEYSWMVYAGWQKPSTDLSHMKHVVANCRRNRKSVRTSDVPNMNDPRFEAMQEAYRQDKRLKRSTQTKMSSDEIKQKVIHEIERMCIRSATEMEAREV